MITLEDNIKITFDGYVSIVAYGSEVVFKKLLNYICYGRDEGGVEVNDIIAGIYKNKGDVRFPEEGQYIKNQVDKFLHRQKGYELIALYFLCKDNIEQDYHEKFNTPEESGVLEEIHEELGERIDTFLQQIGQRVDEHDDIHGGIQILIITNSMNPYWL